MAFFLCSLFLFAGIVFLCWVAARFIPKAAEHAYRSRGTLLTPAEQRFHSALRASLPPHIGVSFKVRLADVVACRKGDYKQAAQNKIQSKHLDFVLVHETNSRILAAIELDDASHGRADRIARDRFVDRTLASADIKLVRIRAAATYDPAQLTATLIAALKPTV